MQTKRCAACGREFHPHLNSPRQTYCSKQECQRARKRRWQQEKIRSDPDYVDNQIRARQAWSSRNADYWRRYREEHPDYVNQNRKKQYARNARNRGKPVAKMDTSNGREGAPSLHSGLYWIHPVDGSVIAKMDVCIVEIRLLSRLSPQPP